jgi:ABC-type transport system involved in cytochrome c biogenesis permease subunit
MTLPLGYVAAFAWLLASVVYALPWPRHRRWGDVLALVGSAAGGALLASLWAAMDRPPLRTLGETRWWYATLVPLVALLAGWRFRTRALGIPACLMGAAFALVNLRHPEYMDKTLLPALQSPWFVPHVVVNMASYAALGLGSLVAVTVLVRRKIRRESVVTADVDLPHRLVLIGFPLLTCGLVFGAFWAKEAWGHYWAWDPKETWAFLTWSAYLGYLHVRARHGVLPARSLALLAAAFVVLLASWFGVQYLPTASESVHTYARD